jgi:hypothetical protein
MWIRIQPCDQYIIVPLSVGIFFLSIFAKCNDGEERDQKELVLATAHGGTTVHLLDLRRATSESRGEQSLWSFARPNSQLGKLFKFLHVLLYRVPIISIEC